MIADANGGGVRELTNLKSPEKFQSESPSWSPDGKTILASGVMSDVGVGVFAVDVESGSVRRVGEAWGFLRTVQWMPDGGSFLIDGIDRNGTGTTVQIWRVAYPSGRASRVTNDLNVYSGVSVSGDGRSVATVQTEFSAGIAVASVGGDAWRTVTPPTARGDGGSGLSLLPDGRIVYSAAASALPQLWIVNADGSGSRQLTTLSAPVIAPSATADGRWVYFHTFVTAGVCVFRIAPDGSGLEQVTREGDEFVPIPSPDGRTIYVARRRSGRTTVARVGVDTADRTPVAISDSGFRMTSISADGLHLVGSVWDGEKSRYVTATMPASGGRPKFIEGVRGDAVWAKEGGLIYPIRSAQPTGLFLTTTAGGQGRPITAPIPDRLFSGSISPDGKRIAISHGSTASDVVLITARPDTK